MSKDTLQLPKTAFSMKANLPTKEPEILKKWESNKLFEKLRKNSVYRDQLIGNKQMPVSDYAATLDNYDSYSGQVISVGEKPNLAIENPEASSRMALAEAITNI